MRLVRLHVYAVTFAGTIALHAFAKHAVAQDHHHPAGLETQLHEKFYSTWFMPDQPKQSCCNKADCYPTEVRVSGDMIYARRREDGKWMRIPAQKIERNRDSPDGRSHLCAPPPTTLSSPDSVYCFALGSGT